MRTLRTLFLMLLLLSAVALACNFGQSPATPTAFVATEPAPLPTATTPPADTAVPAMPPTSDFTTYTDEDLGLTFRYPAGWTLDAAGGFITVVSREDLLTTDRFDSEGAGILISAGPDDELLGSTASLEEALVAAIEDLGFAEEQEVIEGPTMTTVSGQEAAVATVLGRDGTGTPTTVFYVTLIHSRGRAALAAGVTLPQETGEGDPAASPYRETLETIATSIELIAPAGPVLEGNLAYGESGRGTVPEDGSSAWTFSGVAGERVNITVEPLDPELDVTVDVLNSSGQSILPEGTVDEAFGTESVRRLPLEEDDEYTILLRGFAGSAGDYNLTLNEVTSTAEGEAVILSPENSIAGNVGTDEVDTYLLTEVISRPVTVLVEPDPDFDVVVDLYGPEGDLLASSDAGFEGQSERLSFTAEGGNLQVRGYTGATGGYTITLLQGSSEAAGSTIFVADTLTGEEAHLYPFYSPAGQLVSALVEPEADLDVVVEVWHDEEELLMETVDLSYDVEQVNYAPPVEGNYSLSVYGFEGATGTYTITLQGTAATIFELAPGDQVAGRLAQGTPLEYFFRVAPETTVTFTAEGQGESDVTLVLEDLDGNVLDAVDDTAAGGSETLTFTAPAGAEDLFLLRIAEYRGETGSFTLLVE